MPRRAIGVSRAVLLLLALVFTVVGQGSAHGLLRRSMPSAGSRMLQPVSELRLEFNEAVELNFVRVIATDSSGRRVDAPVLERSPDRRTITATSPGFAQLRGAVTVTWRVVGADGHPVEGSFGFVVDVDASPAEGASDETSAADAAEHAGHDITPAAASPVADSTPAQWGHVEGPVASLLRWSQYLWLLVLVGTWAAVTLVLPRARLHGEAEQQHLAGRTRTLQTIALVGLGVTLLARLAAQGDALGLRGAGQWTTLLWSTAWGLGWTLAVIGVAGYGVLSAREGSIGSAKGIAKGIVLAVVAVALALMGHGSGAPTPWIAVSVSALHMLGAGVWLGTLAWLVIVLLPLTVGVSETRAKVVRAFSPAALAGAAMLFLSGALTAWRYVGTPEALVATPYGRLLLAKLGVLALVALTGLFNWRVIVPVVETARAGTQLRRTALLELVIAAVVLAITARLVVVAPPALLSP